MLYTARSKRFMTEEGVLEAVETCKRHGIEGVVVIGGDGSFRGARDLSNHGIPCVGVPGTIDNDISSTEYTIGFDTAMNTAIEMIDKIRDTAQSHHRCSVIEVMGRHAGYIALQVGIATGATGILVPEIPVDLDRLVKKIVEVEKTGIDSRATVLGHVQRGGSPTVRDRVRATQMGNAAVHLLYKGIGNRVVAYRRGEIVDFDIFEALNMIKTFDAGMIDVAHETAI